jgi:hypothetical protein
MTPDERQADAPTPDWEAAVAPGQRWRQTTTGTVYRVHARWRYPSGAVVVEVRWETDGVRREMVLSAALLQAICAHVRDETAYG